MKIGFVIGKLVPMHDENGSAVAAWAIVETARQLGHEVFVIAYNVNLDPGSETGVPAEKTLQARRTCEQRGIRVHLVDKTAARKPLRVPLITSLRKTVFPNVRDAYQGFRFASEVDRLVALEKPDALIAWTVDAAAAAERARARVRASLLSLTDLDHLAREFRARRLENTARHREFLQQQRRNRKLAGFMVSLAQPFEVVINHAHHHCQWLKANGVPQARYLPVPVLEPAARSDGRSREEDGRPTVLHVGKLLGAATYPGLELLGESVVPHLDKLAETMEFKLKIAGRGALPPELARKLNRPYIELCGYVPDLSAEFQNCALFLAPTPVELGFRTRIAEAFMHGCCVVAHQANALGMPELRSGENVLLGGSGEEIAAQIGAALKDPDLRESLRVGARRTFERHYDGRAVSTELLRDLERAVG